MDDLYKMMLISVLVSVLMSLGVRLYRNNLWVKCERQRRKLTRQGIKGPSPSLLYGNVTEMQRIQSAVAEKEASSSSSSSSSPSCSFNNGAIVGHDYTSSIFPYFEQWRKEYGPIYTYSTGNRQHLYVNEAELVKEMSQSMSSDLGKPSYITKALSPLLGNGILRSNGLFWAHQRKIIAAQFFMDKVKGMVGLMKEATEPLLEKWESSIEAQGGLVADIRVDEDLRAISGDMISRACFGSSYYKGKHIFLKLRTLQKLISNQNFLFKVPSLSLLNSKGHCKEVKSLRGEVDTLIWEAVQERVQECSNECSPEKDLMQWILDEAMNDPDLTEESSKQLIVDNCKNIYFAGHESTAVAASWCLMLLALHPEWQNHIRAEIDQICKANGDTHFVPHPDSLLKMKSVTMVIQEALRLYPPAAFISREALQEFQLGSIVVPKGVCLWTLIPTLHRDPEIWGADANEFKPDRFEHGLSNASKVPQAYVPFGLGARLCLGKNFAMVELKLLLCLIISKFNFTLSPNYRHCPAYRMIVEPGNGVHILIKRI